MAEHDMDSRDLQAELADRQYQRVLEAGGPAAAEYLCLLWSGDEWVDDGDVNQWEIANQLLELLPHLREGDGAVPRGVERVRQDRLPLGAHHPHQQDGDRERQAGQRSDAHGWGHPSVLGRVPQALGDDPR